MDRIYDFSRGVTTGASPLSMLRDWRPLREAPRDGTWLLIAVAPSRSRILDGFVTFGRWVYAREIETPNYDMRQRLKVADGWWTNSVKLKPLQRPVLAWMPAPIFDFAAYEAEHESRSATA